MWIISGKVGFCWDYELIYLRSADVSLIIETLRYPEIGVRVRVVYPYT